METSAKKGFFKSLSPKMCFSLSVDIFKTTRDINIKPTPYDRGAKIREYVFHRFLIQVAVSEKLNENGFESINFFIFFYLETGSYSKCF